MKLAGSIVKRPTGVNGIPAVPDQQTTYVIRSTPFVVGLCPPEHGVGLLRNMNSLR